MSAELQASWIGQARIVLDAARQSIARDEVK